MTFQVYSTLTKNKQDFEPLQPGKVLMYNCGPTVYGRAHIGNLRSFLFADLLRRWLEHEGYDVRQVMNITDVGHLTDDADDGEDKLDVAARKEGRDPWQISKQYADIFLEDLKRLNCKPAAVNPRATDHIPEMLEIIDKLVEDGYAYAAGSGENVYFEVSKFERYGRLSGNRVEDLDAGARIAINKEKRAPADFALWKSDPSHLMKWESHYGPNGFPGWHIECSAMARKHLGDCIDIHTGGEDNVFPHHECEIAQSEAFSGESFATYWMHAKFLQVDGGKMSKSLGNIYSVDDVVERGFEERVLRFTLLRGHYRQPLNFTWEIVKESARVLEKLDDLVVRLRRLAAGVEGPEDSSLGADLVQACAEEFRAGMNDDLNTPRGMAAIHNLRDHVVQGRVGAEAAPAGLALMEEFEGVLGVLRMEEEQLDQAVETLIEERNRAREGKDWARSDEIRDELLAQGILLEDTGGTTVWRRK
ncbi:MAG: cysteinyl-tRNA synthetase [Candidatus Paceibacteria bacterium]|jgi:cysteinyl-tRNA synthetase